MAAVAAELQGEVTILGVPSAGSMDEFERFIADTGVDGIDHVADLDGSIWVDFEVTYQPAFVLVDDDGSFSTFVRSLSPSELADRVAELQAS